MRLRATAQEEGILTPSALAKKLNSIVTINGDFFHPSYSPVGLAIGDGKLWKNSADSERSTFIACTANNECELDLSGTKVETKSSWTEAVGGIFVLVRDGVVRTPAEDATCPDLCQVEHPRTAVGLSQDKKNLWLVVVEGRQGSVQGMSLAKLAQFLKEHDIYEAINLDGGGSSAMIVQGNRVTGRPNNEPQERVVANHLSVLLR